MYIIILMLFLQASRGTGSVRSLKEPDDDPKSQYKDNKATNTEVSSPSQN